MGKRHIGFDIWWPESPRSWGFLRRYLIPHPGTLIMTLLVVAGVLWASSAGALPLRIPSAAGTATGTIAYQGRLADSAGNPLTGTYNMIFRLYDVPTGGAPLWEEQWTGSNGVRVSDGLFNVMLGSLEPIPQSVIAGHDQLWLGITVGTDDEMQPRVQLGSVPFAVQALTVPDGSITTEKIADGAVTTAKLNIDNGITVTKSWPQIELRDPATTNKGQIGIGTLRMTFNTGDPPVERMAILHSNGNVGIGTENPQARLDVVSDATNVNVARFSCGAGGWCQNIITNGGAKVADWGVSSYGVFMGANSADKLYLRTAAIERVTIDASGRVGIGTTTPSARLHVNGDFLVTNGTKSAVVNTADYSQRKLYAAESPEVRFFDEGLARLHDGVARVELDPIFLETIEGDYLVHVTPYGDASLYVAEVGKDYFVVKAREGDPNVTFAWRLSAIRKGYAGVRLEEAD